MLFTITAFDSKGDCVASGASGDNPEFDAHGAMEHASTLMAHPDVQVVVILWATGGKTTITKSES